MNLHALGTRVLVKMEPREQEQGGIFLPDAYVQRENIGKVVSIGDYVELVDIDDNILISQNRGIDIIIDDEEYTIIEEIDILGRLENDTEKTLSEIEKLVRKNS